MSTKKEHKVKVILAEKMEELKASQNTRLDKIEAFVKEELKQINDRNKAIQGFVVREVKFDIANQLYNMQITMDAFLEILAESGVFLDGFNDKLDAKKKELHERRTKEAEAKMQENIGNKKEEVTKQEESNQQAVAE